MSDIASGETFKAGFVEEAIIQGLPCTTSIFTHVRAFDCKPAFFGSYMNFCGQGICISYIGHCYEYYLDSLEPCS